MKGPSGACDPFGYLKKRQGPEYAVEEGKGSCSPPSGALASPRSPHPAPSPQPRRLVRRQGSHALQPSTPWAANPARNSALGRALPPLRSSRQLHRANTLTSQAALGGAAGLGPRVSESEGVPPQCLQISSVICIVRRVRDRTTQKQDHFHPETSETRSGEMSGL